MTSFLSTPKHLRISAQVFLKRRKKRNRKTKKQNSQNWEFFLSLVFRSKVNSSLSIKSWYQVVNGKIRLLCKVENPSVPFLNLLSLTISKIVHHGIQSNFQEDDAFQGFQSPQGKKAWLSHAHCNYGGQDQRDTLPYNAWVLPSEEFRTRDRNLCNAGSGLLR